MRKDFTPEEMAALAANPYTYAVTRTQLSFTLEGKVRIAELYKAKHAPAYIFKELGYDTKVLGEGRMSAIARRVYKEASSESGLHEGHRARKPKRMDIEEIESLGIDSQSIESLKNEVLYLRQEVEFLKKISLSANTKKRDG